ncbi:MAG: hypothetical protein IH983_04845 [Planctomycetes bacterium]|nr:hypothetical protein [Planctomycetota bacterium]
MSVSAVSSSGFAAIAAGLRGEMKAKQFSQALATFGLLDDSLAKALQALEDQSRAVREAGVARLQVDQLGVLFDALA